MWTSPCIPSKSFPEAQSIELWKTLMLWQKSSSTRHITEITWSRGMGLTRFVVEAFSVEFSEKAGVRATSCSYCEFMHSALVSSCRKKRQMQDSKHKGSNELSWELNDEARIVPVHGFLEQLWNKWSVCQHMVLQESFQSAYGYLLILLYIWTFGKHKEI